MTYLASVTSIHKSKAALLIAVFVLCSSLASWAQMAPANEPTQPAALSGSRTLSHKGAIVIKEFKHDTGPLLREIAPLLPEFSPPSEHEIENNVNPNHNWSNQVQEDPVLQTEENSPHLQTPIFGLEFDGIGVLSNFFCNCMPPDDDGAPGTTQYVQYVNLTYQVWDKAGNSVLGPLAGNDFWSGFGGSCQTDNSGDTIIRFDAAAQRWVVSQFALNGSAPDYECVAVSTTDDATGSCNRYAFPFNDFPDYPKMGVWPDAYYFTFNNFNIAGNAYVGANVCAADRTKMLAGSAATIQCFLNPNDFGMLPSDLDGATPPTAGTPNFVMELDPTGNPNLDMFKFHVDFVTPANSTFTGPTLIPVAAFTPLCNTQFRGRCVPQPTAGSDLLESLGDRLMWRLVYRNFGDHTTLLTTHSIVVGSSGGVRWYEIHNPETSPTLFQSGTFAPDSDYRWMPAIAMDASQDIAVGYSRSSTTANHYPSLVYAGRIPTDPAGTLEAEVVLKAGLGSQTGGGSRWGDYSSLTVDPTDDCTFWFAEEYEAVTGGFNWHTAIGSFIFPGCGADFAFGASPSSLTILQGGNGTSTITVTSVGGFNAATTLSASGLPNGVTAGFVPNPITPPVGGNATSTLTLTASGSATTGTATVTVTGTSGALVHTTNIALTVNPDFTYPNPITNPNNANPGQFTTTTMSISPKGGNLADNVTYTCSAGLPAGTTCSFNPPQLDAGTSGGTVTITVQTAGPFTGGASPSQRKLRAQNQRLWLPLSLPLASMVLVGLAGRSLPRRYKIVGLCLALALTGFLLACGSSSSSPPPPPPISVTVTPNPLNTLYPNSILPGEPPQGQKFTAVVNNSSDQGISSWQVNGVAGGNATFGTIDANGNYSAPAAVPNPATFNVTAVAHADASKSGNASVTIQTPTLAGPYPITVTVTEGPTVHTTGFTLTVN